MTQPDGPSEKAMEQILGPEPQTLADLKAKVGAIYEEQCDMKDWEAATSRLAELITDIATLEAGSQGEVVEGYAAKVALTRYRNGSAHSVRIYRGRSNSTGRRAVRLVPLTRAEGGE